MLLIPCSRLVHPTVQATADCRASAPYLGGIKPLLDRWVRAFPQVEGLPLGRAEESQEEGQQHPAARHGAWKTRCSPGRTDRVGGQRGSQCSRQRSQPCQDPRLNTSLSGLTGHEFRVSHVVLRPPGKVARRAAERRSPQSRLRRTTAKKEEGPAMAVKGGSPPRRRSHESPDSQHPCPEEACHQERRGRPPAPGWAAGRTPVLAASCRGAAAKPHPGPALHPSTAKEASEWLRLAKGTGEPRVVHRAAQSPSFPNTGRGRSQRQAGCLRTRSLPRQALARPTSTACLSLQVPRWRLSFSCLPESWPPPRCSSGRQGPPAASGKPTPASHTLPRSWDAPASAQQAPAQPGPSPQQSPGPHMPPLQGPP